MKRRLLYLAVILMLALSMTACGKKKGSTNNSAPTFPANKEIKACTVTFWHGMTGAQAKTLTELTDKFNAENKFGIKVELVSQGAYKDLNSKLDASVLSGELPDLSQVYNNWVSDYVDKLITLDNFIAADFDNWEDIVAGFREEANAFGEYKVIPFNKSTYVYFYNKTLFDELNLKAPTNWDELVSCAKVIKEKKNLATIGWDDMTAALDTAIIMNGGTFDDKGVLIYDNAAAKEAMEWMLGLFKDGYATLVGDDDYFSTKLSNNNIAGYIGSSTGASYITPNGFELGVAPVYTGKTSAAYQAGTNIAMFSTDSNQQMAAWEYLKFLTSAESTTTWAMATGYLPIRYSAINSTDYQNYVKDSLTAQATSEQIKSQNFTYGGCYKGANDIRNAIAKKMPVYIGENKTADEAIKDLKAEIDYILSY